MYTTSSHTGRTLSSRVRSSILLAAAKKIIMSQESLKDKTIKGMMWSAADIHKKD